MAVRLTQLYPVKAAALDFGEAVTRVDVHRRLASHSSCQRASAATRLPPLAAAMAKGWLGTCVDGRVVLLGDHPRDEPFNVSEP